jgi:signal recognition particle subunit SRP54
MTPKERERPALINAKRKIRIANGSGTTVQDVNKLLKMHQEMEGAMKKIRKMGGLKGLAKMFGKSGGIWAATMGGMGCRKVRCPRVWAACPECPVGGRRPAAGGLRPAVEQEEVVFI